MCEATRIDVKYTWIERHRRQCPVTLQCEVLGVSARGYFERQVGWQAGTTRGTGTTQQVGEAGYGLAMKRCWPTSKPPMRPARDNTAGEYGWPRIWKELLDQGVRVGKERIQKLMRLHGIEARGKRRFVVTTTDSNHDLPDYCQSPPTCWRATLVRPRRMQSGREVSRTCRQRRAGCTWRR